jgi:hypothetical protein
VDVSVAVVVFTTTPFVGVEVAVAFPASAVCVSCAQFAQAGPGPAGLGFLVHPVATLKNTTVTITRKIFTFFMAHLQSAFIFFFQIY